MKKRTLLLAAIFLELILVGCSSQGKGTAGLNTGEAKTSEAAQSESKSEGSKMTNQEKEFMKRVSFDKEAVEAGALEDWQEELLKELRAGDDYLKKKYPGAALEIVNCETRSSKEQFDRFTVIETGDGEHFYEMRIKVKEDKYDITDDYYEHVIQDAAQEKIKEIVDKTGLPCIRVKASFDTFLGAEYDENISVDDVLSGKISADNGFQIYLEEEKLDHGSYKDNVQEVKEAMNNNEIVGYFTVIIGTDDSKASVYRESFSLNN